MHDSDDPVAQAEAALRGQVWANPPSVAPLRSDVRSGESFLFTAATGLPDLFVGAVIVEWGFEVTKDQAAAFHQWLADNERALADESPAGTRYRGTYGVFAQSQNELGSYRTIWSFDSLSAMELLGKEVADQTTFGKRLQALTAFRDERIGAARSQQIYHPAAIAQRT